MKKFTQYLIIALILFVIASSFTLFEDGSWIIETFQIRWISGCLPSAICSL